MKKIYIISRQLNHGGIEKIVCNLSNLFIDMNHDVEILCAYYTGDPVYYLNDKVKVTYLIDHPPKNTSLKKSLRKLNFIKFANDFYTRYAEYYLHKEVVINSIKDIESSIIISTRNEYNKLINKHSKRGNKLIAQLHCDHTQFKGYSKDIKYKYNNMDYLLLLNKELKNEVESMLIGCNQKVKCLAVPNFIQNKKTIEGIERKKQIISVGRLSPEKGFDRLLLIWKKFIVNNEDYILKIVGDGHEKEKLIRLAQTLNISNSVVFTGYLNNNETVKEIQKSKIYVMTSVNEAFGIVLLEAVTQGIPIVAYDVRVGPRSIIKDGYNGFLVKENDVETFIERLNCLLEEDDIYYNMSKNAITSSKLYSEEHLKARWFDILNKPF